MTKVIDTAGKLLKNGSNTMQTTLATKQTVAEVRLPFVAVDQYTAFLAIDV